MSTPGGGAGDRPRVARYFFPRSHRLFARFEDRTAADVAVAALAEAGFGVDDVWIFEGQAGAAEFEPGDVGGIARIMSLWLSQNVEILRDFSRAVRGGTVVVAVPVRGYETTDQMARVLRAEGGEGLVYTAHGNFMPVAPEPS